jgi:hypothetical protein
MRGGFKTLDEIALRFRPKSSGSSAPISSTAIGHWPAPSMRFRQFKSAPNSVDTTDIRYRFERNKFIPLACFLTNERRSKRFAAEPNPMKSHVVGLEALVIVKAGCN